MTYAASQDWAEFLAPVAHAVTNRPDRETFTGTCAACADALAIRREWMTPLRRREAMAQFKFWPAVADISELFTDDKRHAAFMRAATALPPPETAAPERPTHEQIEANRAKVAALKAELSANFQIDKPSAGPAYLAPHQLLAAYEAEAAKGNHAAAFRAAHIRASLSA